MDFLIERMTRQGLAARSADTTAGVASAALGLQAQDTGAARFGVRARSDAVDEASVSNALHHELAAELAARGIKLAEDGQAPTHLLVALSARAPTWPSSTRICSGAACCATGSPPLSAPWTARTVTASTGRRSMTPNCS